MITSLECLILLAIQTTAPEVARPNVQQPGAVVKLNVDAAEAPIPALRYQLLPALKELNPGNAVQGYYHASIQNYEFYWSTRTSDDRERWRTMPLANLPRKELLKAGYGPEGLLKELAAAARLDDADWQVLAGIKREGFAISLNETQHMRVLARALAIRCRLELAEKRYDDAISTLATMFAIAKHTGVHPSVIGYLVGVAITGETLDRLEEVIQQPNAPNLYWALVNLPQPFLCPRVALESEEVMVNSLLGNYDLEEPLSKEQIKELVLTRLGPAVNMDRQKTIQFLEIGEEHILVETARKRLLAAGKSKEFLKQLSPVQIVLLDDYLRYQIFTDDMKKLALFPYWEAKPRYQRLRVPTDGIFIALVPSFLGVVQADARLKQRLAFLTCMEALRIHAAETGSFPESLDAVPLPLPADPVSGKPFSYSLAGSTARITGTAVDSQEGSPKSVAYEITLSATRKGNEQAKDSGADAPANK